MYRVNEIPSIDYCNWDKLNANDSLNIFIDKVNFDKLTVKDTLYLIILDSSKNSSKILKYNAEKIRSENFKIEI